MMLHCEPDAGVERELFSVAAPWLRPQTFQSLTELNEQFLELLAEQAMMRSAQASLMLRQIGELWRTLDAGARRRAAACPYLLADAGFADAHRWRWTGNHQVADREHAPQISFFTVPGATAIARLVFNYAWYLARTQDAAARLVLGTPAQCATTIASCTLRQIHELAERHPDWLKPRWPTRVRVWRELLLAAASGEGVALERVRMHGLQLLAAEARAAAISGTAIALPSS